jgi:hypothetical protein
MRRENWEDGSGFLPWLDCDASFVDRRSWHFHESGFPVTSLLPPVSPTHLQRADGIHKLPSELLTYIYVCRRPARGLCEARTHIKANKAAGEAVS